MKSFLRLSLAEHTTAHLRAKLHAGHWGGKLPLAAVPTTGDTNLGLRIDFAVRLHPKRPLLALLGLVHVQVARTLLVLRRTRRGAD